MLLAARAFATSSGMLLGRHSVAREAGDLERPAQLRRPSRRRRRSTRRRVPSASRPSSRQRARALLSGARAASARAFTRSTAGSSAAQTAPCGAANMPPSGAAKPCTAPSPAFARHRPPNRLASARASRSTGSIGPPARAAAYARGKRRRGARDAVARERVGDGVGADRQERLDELRQRIETARREHRGRQTGEQVRIDDRHARQHERAAQARLDPVLGRREHGVLRHLGAGAGGGRDRDQRQRRARERLSAADHLQVVERVTAVRGQRGDRLRGVERAAAAEADHQIAARRARRRRARARRVDGRLAVDGENASSERRPPRAAR